MNNGQSGVVHFSLFVLHSSFGQPISGRSADQPNPHEFGYDKPGTYFWMAAMRVYVLQHTHSVEGTEDVQFVGVYSSRDNARAAIARLSSTSGFSEAPDGFCIDEYQLDKDQWVEGYSSRLAEP